MALISRRYIDSVVALGRLADDGKANWCASGFIYAHVLSVDETRGLSTVDLYVVTNKHVVENLDAISVLLNTAEGKPRRIDTTFGAGWPQQHETADLAAFPIPPELLSPNEWSSRIFTSQADIITRQMAEEIGVADGSDCYLIGFFPVWLIEEGRRSYPVVRHGSIARMQDYLDEHSDTILIDAMNFPGNSGGPVITRPAAFSIAGTPAPARAGLLGVISSYIPHEEKAYSIEAGGKLKERISFRENAGLAEIVPAETLANWIASFPESKEAQRTGQIEKPESMNATDK